MERFDSSPKAPEVLITVRTSSLSCMMAGKAPIFTVFGKHPGNPGSNHEEELWIRR